jgi:hypothetical protein
LTDYGCGRHEDTRPGLQTSRRVLSGARNIAELRHRRQDARRIYESRLVHIESGQVATSLLIIEQVSSRDIEDYCEHQCGSGLGLSKMVNKCELKELMHFAQLDLKYLRG